MINRPFQFTAIFLILFFSCSTHFKLRESGDENTAKGSYYTSVYDNQFIRLLGKTEAETNKRLDSIFNIYFYGDDKDGRLYFPVGDDMAYIEDILHEDVRTEGMSYGMMIAVQLDKKKEFDRLWKWAKTYMQHNTEERMGYFAWHCKTDGSKIDSNSASDGEVWFVMSLFFASARWGDGEGIYNYRAEAQFILDNMLNKDLNAGSKITNMFDKKEKQVVFVPSEEAAWFTDPSYHVPHYYELWARWADKNNSFWCDAAKVSRDFFKKAAHPMTGLMPDYAKFDGSPISPFGGSSENFQYDAWRCAMNIAMDYAWFAKDKWQIEQLNRYLTFFYKQGMGKYGSLFTLDGKQLGREHSVGIISMNAAGAISASVSFRKDFIEELWNSSIPLGKYRYYDGMLYMLAMLQVSGNFKIYDPIGKTIEECNGNK